MSEGLHLKESCALRSCPGEPGSLARARRASGGCSSSWCFSPLAGGAQHPHGLQAGCPELRGDRTARPGRQSTSRATSPVGTFHVALASVSQEAAKIVQRRAVPTSPSSPHQDVILPHPRASSKSGNRQNMINSDSRLTQTSSRILFLGHQAPPL